MNNANESSVILNEQRVYSWIVNNAFWDNWTDSYFINAAITEYEGNVWQRIFANAYTVLPGYENEPLVCLEHAIKSTEYTEQIPYSRYWAGATSLIKTLLIFTDINGIRSLIFGFVLLLVGITCINLFEALGNKGCMAFGLSVFASMYIPNSLCITFSFDVIIMLITMNICWYKIKKNDSFESYWLLFGIIGSVCSYIGYWAFPLITLGIPLVFITALRLKDGIKQHLVIKENFLCSITWTMGIVITIGVKQILDRLFLGEQSGTERITMWMGVDSDLRKRLESVINGLTNEMQQLV